MLLVKVAEEENGSASPLLGRVAAGAAIGAPLLGALEYRNSLKDLQYKLVRDSGVGVGNPSKLMQYKAPTDYNKIVNTLKNVQFPQNKAEVVGDGIKMRGVVMFKDAPNGKVSGFDRLKNMGKWLYPRVPKKLALGGALGGVGGLAYHGIRSRMDGGNVGS